MVKIMVSVQLKAVRANLDGLVIHVVNARVLYNAAKPGHVWTANACAMSIILANIVKTENA
jgi:hypothetical protein